MWKAVQNVFQLHSQGSRLPASLHLKNNLLLTCSSSSSQCQQLSPFSVSSTPCSFAGAISTSGLGSSSVSFLRPWAHSGQNQRTSPEESSIASYGLNQVTVYVPSRGMKVKGRVNRRCKDCQLEWLDGVLYNFCKTHPRHKQMLKQQYWPNLRILTHATQGPRLPWKQPVNGWNRRSTV